MAHLVTACDCLQDTIAGDIVKMIEEDVGADYDVLAVVD